MTGISSIVSSYEGLKNALENGANQYLDERANAGWFSRFFSRSGTQGLLRAKHLKQILASTDDVATPEGKKRILALANAVFATSSHSLVGHITAELIEGEYSVLLGMTDGRPYNSLRSSVFDNENLLAFATVLSNLKYEGSTDSTVFRSLDKTFAARTLLMNAFAETAKKLEGAILVAEFKEQLESKQQDVELAMRRP